jgi:hypothetical protein
MTPAEQNCRFCNFRLGDGDSLDATGEAHAACVEAHRDDRVAAGNRESPMKRFMRVWWGAGHH